MSRVALLVALVACQRDVGSTDGAFYAWDGRQVHCAIDIDSSALNDFSSIETGLDRARDRGEVVELYAHHPGVTVGWDTVERVLAGARDRGLAFVTYADFAAGIAPTAGLALSFDDAFVPAWVSGRDLFQSYGARLTFFLAFYDRYSATDLDSIRTLAADGHDIEAHSVRHIRAPQYVEDHGIGAYLADEVQPSIDRLRADGYPVTTYAYPFGARTAELDGAILGRVSLVRSVAFTWSGVTEPCPH